MAITDLKGTTTFQIPVDAPEGVRMLVKDTECKKDIDVIPVLQNKTITENGTYTADSGFAGFGEMIVDVPTPTPTTEKKTVTPSKSVQKVTATGADYLSEVTVSAIPDEYEIPIYFNPETDIVLGEETLGNIAITVASFSTLTFTHKTSNGNTVESKTASSGTVSFSDIASGSYIAITGGINMFSFGNAVNCVGNTNDRTITDIGENATISVNNAD